MPAQPPPDRRRYAPLTPSPLNPNTYLNVTKVRQQQQQRQPALRAKPPNANPSNLPQQYAALAHASPTERLVRQKAAAAWRCETLRHYVLLKPQPGSEHARSDHHYLIDFTLNPPPTPANNSHNHNHNHNHNNHSSSGSNNRPPPSPTPQPNPHLSPSPPTLQGNHAWPPHQPPNLHNHHHTPLPTPYADNDHTEHTDDDDDISGDIGLGINPRGYRYRYRDGFNDEGSFPLTSPLLSPTLLLLGGPASGSSSGSSSGEMVLPLHAGSSSGGNVKQRAGRRRVGAGAGKGSGGGGVVGVRRVLVVVALLLGMGLVHGLVSAFGSRGGGRPPPPVER